MKKVLFLLGILLFWFVVPVRAQSSRVLDAGIHHLRNGTLPEWSGFGSTPKPQLEVHFEASANATELTLRLRQEDVKQPWLLQLNGRELGRLQEDENSMLGYWAIPAGLLRTGTNILTIRPRTTTVTDDIRVGEIRLLDQPLDKVLHQATIQVTVLDRKTNRPLPAKITVTSSPDGLLQPVGATSTLAMAVRSGCVYTAPGRATLGLPEGTYTLYASRGFEYSVDSVKIQIKAGEERQLTFYLTHEVLILGWVASDTHVHTYTHSHHGDATDRERVLTLAGEGVELPVLTDHNTLVDLRPVMREMQMDGWFTPVIGNEYTTPVGHFNTFPELPGTPILDHRVNDWDAVAQKLGNASGPKAIILNHARDVHNSFRPFGPDRHLALTGTDLNGWVLPANAMEVLNSGSQQTDVLQLHHDWFGMLNRGYLLTPVGSSDSHDVSRYVVGQSRTYIRYPAGYDAGTINIAQATEAFRHGQVSVSFGLLPQITVQGHYGPGTLAPAQRKAKVNVKVLGPSWIRAERVVLYANGQKIREARISRKGKNGLKWQGTWQVPLGSQDIYLVAVAEGPGYSYPFWAIAKPYQPASPDWQPKVVGSTGAVWIDADRDGQRTSAYDYARRVLSASGDDISTLFEQLKKYDQSVVVQVAQLLKNQPEVFSESTLKEALLRATPAIKNGFATFEKAWQESLSARQPE